MRTVGLAWESETLLPRPTHRGNELPPLVADGYLFSGTMERRIRDQCTYRKTVVEFDPSDGMDQRACVRSESRSSSVGIKLVVATLDGYLVSLDRNTGKENWRVDTFMIALHELFQHGSPRIAGRNVVIGMRVLKWELAAMCLLTISHQQVELEIFHRAGDPSKGPDESPDAREHGPLEFEVPGGT